MCRAPLQVSQWACLLTVDGETRYAALTDILGAEDALGDGLQGGRVPPSS